VKASKSTSRIIRKRVQMKLVNKCDLQVWMQTVWMFIFCSVPWECTNSKEKRQLTMD
jgi:hypothetical protein